MSAYSHPNGILKDGIQLYLVRHGETDWNREARYQGQTDIPLNALGRSQARRNGDMLRQTLGNVSELAFVSSPLSRAVETMRLIRREMALDADDFRIDPMIMELNYGHWEGQLASSLTSVDAEGVAAKAADPFSWRPKGGESYSDLSHRIAIWLKTIEQTTIAVTHGGVSRVARGLVLGLDNSVVPSLCVPQDKVLVLTSETMTWL